jgi:hypothetical protein
MFSISEIIILLGILGILIVLLGISLLAAHIVAMHRLGDKDF